MRLRKVKKVWAILGIILAVLLIGSFLALIMRSGIFLAPKYLEPWDRTYHTQWDDPRIQLIAHGLLASNGHNMQPWRIKLDPKDPMVFYLYADSKRFTNEADPLARQMMISNGTFLEYVRIAGDQIGYKADTLLFPDGVYDEDHLKESMKQRPVAKVSLLKKEAGNNPLYPSMFLPDTNRAAYQSEELTNGQMDQLLAIKTENEITIKIVQGKEGVDQLGEYAMKGAMIEAGLNRLNKELEAIFRSNEYQKNQYRYGFSVEGQGTDGMMKHIMQGLVSFFPSMNQGKAASDILIQSTRTSVQNTPAYAYIVTEDNTRSSQVKSGMLYSRLILEAHRLGLVMQPLSQVLEEYPEMGEVYREIHRQLASNGGTIQMLVRIGYPTKEVPRTMRRDVMDLIIQA